VLKKSESPGGKPPETFDFLGFTHIAKRSLRGYFTIHVRTMRKRLKRSLKAVTLWCKNHRHDTLEEQQKGLNQKLRGHYKCYGWPTNYPGIWKFYRVILRIWKESLNRRTRGRTVTWEKFGHVIARYPPELPHVTQVWSR